MRFVISLVAAAALMLSACQAPQNNASNAANTQTNTAFQSYDTSGAGGSKYFDVELRKGSHDLQLSLIKSCAGSQSSVELDTCFRQTIVSAFDESGTGRVACANISDIGKFGECISLGNFATAFLHLIPEKNLPPMTTTDWLNPKPYIDRLGVSFGMSVASLCLEANAADMLGCARNETTKLMSVAAAYQSRCNSLPEINKFSRCMGEAYGLRLLDEGISRMTARTGVS